MLDSLEQLRTQHGITTLEAMFLLALIGLLFAAHARLLQTAFRSVHTARKAAIQAVSPTAQLACRSISLPNSSDALLLCESANTPQTRVAFINTNSIEAVE
jgi:hypothetical protein